ncbi:MULTISPECIES: chalcone isomerase family protein [unclassified Cupriavidus]|uniref:chalcone isomerase family protein n=1 Tax=unclassified Cupriavidus TaxID=2640874 RepID=UPI00313B506C
MAIALLATMATIAMMATVTAARAEAWRDAWPGTADVRMVGEGDFRWFGIRIYTAQLWAAQSPVTLDTPLALRLTYARGISGERLTDTSMDEIKRLAAVTIPEATLDQWRAALSRVLPDVRAGDVLTGVYLPGQGARFYAGDRALGALEDPMLARAFFSIWLDPSTRAPALRRHLLGLPS